ncbi:MAG: hypothetical protein ACPHOG_06150 [Verrucomicrobiales bacterium]|tara:strand:+ start:84 stop:428 length:345 start_codon:yes stop_codon:yes gene_type:complete
MSLTKIISRFFLVFALTCSLFSAASSYDEYQGCCCCDYDLSVLCECLTDTHDEESFTDETVSSKLAKGFKIIAPSSDNADFSSVNNCYSFSKLDFTTPTYYGVKYAVRSQVLLI